MPLAFGILAAFVALLSWGFGDFFIQRAIRRIGSAAALFFIGVVGFVILTPFVWTALPNALAQAATLRLLALTLAVTLLVAALEFRAFQVGKLSVVEPIMSLELPVTAGLGLAFLGDRVGPAQLLLIVAVFVGIVLTAVQHRLRHWWQRWSGQNVIERGVILGLLSAVVMSATNVLTGLASRAVGPLVTIWFVHSSLAILCLLVLAIRRQVWIEFRTAARAWRSVLAESVLDNAAWLAYAAAVTMLPISIVIGITESYIALASLLGIILNKERLQRHQLAGIGLALIAAVALAVMTAGA